MPKCPHHHLKFEDGSLHLTCLDCDGVWSAAKSKDDPTPKLERRLETRPYPTDTRHDRFIVPRLHPKSDK